MTYRGTKHLPPLPRASPEHLRPWLPAGFAESAVVSYVISNGKKATKAADLAKSLVGAGLPAGSETERFAAELMGRIPRAGATVSAYRQQERAALAATVQNRSAWYQLNVSAVADAHEMVQCIGRQCPAAQEICDVGAVGR